MKTIRPAQIYRVLTRWLRPNHPSVGPSAGAGVADLAASAPVLDVDAAVERLLGDRPLYYQLLGIFIQTYSTAGERLRAVLQTRDTDPQGSAEATRMVHTLKGAASTIGAQQLTSAAARLEKVLAAGAPQAVAVQLLALESALCAALIAAERFRTDSPAER